MYLSVWLKTVKNVTQLKRELEVLSGQQFRGWGGGQGGGGAMREEHEFKNSFRQDKRGE